MPLLKHSMATHVLDADADLAFVKDWLGHANIQNTTIYVKRTPSSRQKRAIIKIDCYTDEPKYTDAGV